MRVINHSVYRTEDLKRFFHAGLKALGAKAGTEITVLPSDRGYTHGIAEVGGKRITLGIAPPSRHSMRKLARIFEHEVFHTLGVRHRSMTYREYWSLGGVPHWAKGLNVRVNHASS